MEDTSYLYAKKKRSQESEKKQMELKNKILVCGCMVLNLLVDLKIIPKGLLSTLQWQLEWLYQKIKEDIENILNTEMIYIYDHLLSLTHKSQHKLYFSFFFLISVKGSAYKAIHLTLRVHLVKETCRKLIST